MGRTKVARQTAAKIKKKGKNTIEKMIRGLCGLRGSRRNLNEKGVKSRGERGKERITGWGVSETFRRGVAGGRYDPENASPHKRRKGQANAMNQGRARF